jgi:hypothetical protein
MVGVPCVGLLGTELPAGFVAALAAAPEFAGIAPDWAKTIKLGPRDQGVMQAIATMKRMEYMPRRVRDLLAVEFLLSMGKLYRFYQRIQKQGAEHRFRTRLKFRF